MKKTGKRMKKVCKLINDAFSWRMEVDKMNIGFNGGWGADYFADHYRKLGYRIEWYKAHFYNATNEWKIKRGKK